MFCRSLMVREREQVMIPHGGECNDGLGANGGRSAGFYSSDQGVFPTESGYAAGGDGGQRIDMQYPGGYWHMGEWKGPAYNKGISVG